MNRKRAARKFRAFAQTIPLTYLSRALAEEFVNLKNTDQVVVSITRWVFGSTSRVDLISRDTLADHAGSIYARVCAYEREDDIHLDMERGWLLHGLTNTQIEGIKEKIGSRSSWKAYANLIDKDVRLNNLDTSLRCVLATFLASHLSQQEGLWEERSSTSTRTSSTT